MIVYSNNWFGSNQCSYNNNNNRLFIQVTWFRNDRRVCENNHIRCVNEGNFYCVELTPVSLDDVGRWMCMVRDLLIIYTIL